jgi:uncharacterized repeat protein (TIGR01451 family)
VTLTDTLPLNLSFRSCRLVTSNLAGTCTRSGQDVIFTLSKPVIAGASGELEVVADVIASATGQVLNAVALDYTDLLENPQPTVRAEDLDIIPSATPLPNVVNDKAASLSLDNNGNGKADSADQITYAIAVSNTGQVDATGVTLRDTPDANTTLMTGTVAIVQGSGVVVSGNSPGDSDVFVQLGTIAPNAMAQVSFVVEVNSNLPTGTTTISNQAIVRGDNVPDTPSDDPSTSDPDDPTDVPAGDSPGGGPPTAITLIDFRAVTDQDAIRVLWTTGAELRTAGYEILRSSSPDRAGAVSLSDPILARGSGGGGASYTYTDGSVRPGVTYYYWLVEHERDGETQEYGPVTGGVALETSAESNQVFLPIISR